MYRVSRAMADGREKCSEIMMDPVVVLEPLFPPLPPAVFERYDEVVPNMPVCYGELMTSRIGPIVAEQIIELKSLDVESRADAGCYGRVMDFLQRTLPSPNASRPPKPPNTRYFSGDTYDYSLDAISDPTRKHMTWCGICGQNQDPLISCITCCSSYHVSCVHNVAKNNGGPVPYILEYVSKCYYCTLNPNFRANSVVWHKLSSYPWWPAMVLPYTEKPDCLKSPPSKYHVPLCYYGQKNYSWAHSYDICSFSINADLIKKCKKHYFLLALQEAEKDHRNNGEIAFG